jgi:cytochrome c oxidase subunit 2
MTMAFLGRWRGRMASPPGSPRRLLRPVTRLVGLALVGLLAGACAETPATQQGREISSLYAVMLVVVAGLFILVEGLIIWSLLRYRRRRDDPTLPPQIHGHRGLEYLWTVIPILIVLGLYVLSLQTLGKVEARSADPAVTVDVYGYQWYWEFKLPDEGVDVRGIGTTPELVLPVGQPIRFRLHSDNVIHSFFVPAFLFKRDLIPGIDNEFDLTIDDPGTYAGQCAEFCGAGHADMRFTIRAVTPAEFQAWVAQVKAGASPSPGASAAPSPAASGAPSPAASAAPSPVASAAVLRLVAHNITFDTKELQAPANQPFTIDFDNQDPTVIHNVEIRDASGKTVFNGDLVTGPKEVTYSVPALSPGSYTFLCTVHPNVMFGTLTVK